MSLDDQVPALGDAPFGVLDVFKDALGSLGRTSWTHAAWNGRFFALIFLSACASSCVMFPILALVQGGPARSVAGVVVGVVAIYAVYLAGFLALVSLHQGVTHVLTLADLAGETLDLQAAMTRGRQRLAPMTAATLLRVLADLLIGGVPIVVMTLAFLARAEAPGEPNAAADLLLALPGLWLLWLAWIFVVRSFVGLSGVAVQVEELSALAALRRSVLLLRGRRWQFIGMRVLWALGGGGLYALAYLPILGLVLASSTPDAGGQIWTPVIFAYALAWYYFALHLLSFDSILEAAFYARVVRRETAESIARVFA